MKQKRRFIITSNLAKKNNAEQKKTKSINIKIIESNIAIIFITKKILFLAEFQ